jgi:hypothetical protein
MKTPRILRRNGEPWRDALVRYLTTAEREPDDGLGPITDDEISAAVAAFDRHAKKGERDAVVEVLYTHQIPVTRIED